MANRLLRCETTDERSTRISQLLPLVSALNRSRDPSMAVYARTLRETVRDMERLNDIELQMLKAQDEAASSLYTTITQILGRS